MCSKKFRDCHQEQRDKWMDENKDKFKAKPDNNNGDNEDNEDNEGRREAMKKRFEKKIVSYLDMNY